MRLPNKLIIIIIIYMARTKPKMFALAKHLLSSRYHWLILFQYVLVPFTVILYFGVSILSFFFFCLFLAGGGGGGWGEGSRDGWFSSLLREVFLWVVRFPISSKTNIFIFQFDLDDCQARYHESLPPGRLLKHSPCY